MQLEVLNMLRTSKTVCTEVKNPEWAGKSEVNILSWQHLTAIHQREPALTRGHSAPASGDIRGVNKGVCSRLNLPSLSSGSFFHISSSAHSSFTGMCSSASLAHCNTTLSVNTQDRSAHAHTHTPQSRTNTQEFTAPCAYLMTHNSKIPFV